jgi:hypothetical protein
VAVNYLSRPTNLAQYVDPIDVDTLSKTLAYKQQKFDQGVASIQNQISTYQTQVGNLFRETDQQYLQSKIDEYVNTVQQKFGGADFTEASAVNAASSLGSMIYKDDRIINAVKDSRAINTLLQGYQKYKTDPKLMQYYNKNNEDWDMSAIERYKNNPNERYLGSSTPTAYTDVQKKTDDVTKKIEADVRTVLGNDGYMRYIKGVGPEKIREIVKNQLSSDPSVRNQMSINSWASYRGVTSEAVQAEYAQYRMNRAGVFDIEIEKLNNSKKLINPNAPAYAIADKQISYLQDKKAAFLNDNSLDGNIEGMKSFLYQNKYIDGFVAAKSYQQETVKSDPTWIANQRIKQAESQFQRKLNFDSQVQSRQDFWRNKNYELEVTAFNYKKEQDTIDNARKQAELDAKQIGGQAIYAGQQPDSQDLSAVSDVRAQIRGYQEANKQILSNTIIDAIVGNNYELKSQEESIRRIIGNQTVSADQAYKKLSAQGNGLSTGVKQRITALGNAMFREMDAVAQGKMSISDFRSHNIGVFTEGLDQINKNFVGAINLQKQINKAEDESIAQLSKLDAAGRAQVQRQADTFRRNPTSIPQEYLIKASSKFGFNAFNRPDASSTVRVNGREVSASQAIQSEAIRIFQEEKTGVNPDKLTELINSKIPQTALSRKSFTFSKEQLPNAERALTQQILDLSDPSTRTEITDGKQLELGRFTPLSDGSFNVEYRTFTGEGNSKKYDPIKRVTIPANQSQSIKQFLPKGFGTQVPDQEYQTMIQRDKGLYYPNGDPILLTTRGNVPINYTIAKASRDENDTSVQLYVQRVEAGGNTRLVPVTGLGVFPNAASARAAIEQVAQTAPKQGFNNVQDIVKYLTK